MADPVAPAASPPPAAARGPTPAWRRTLRKMLANRAFVVAVILLVIYLLAAAFVPYLAPYAPAEQNVFRRNAPVSADHLLGTDHFGRDVLSRILWGTRVSLLLGIVAPLLAGLLGTMIGAAAGYLGGLLDGLVVRFTDVFMSFPTLLLGVLIAATIGPGFRNVILAISVALLPRFIRFARASTLSVRAEPYVEASVAAGQRAHLIILRHVVPNIVGPILVMTTLWTATAIRLEASLSFLGLGTQPPSPSWGNIIRDGLNNMLGSPLPIIFGGLAVTLAVLSLNIIGDELRDRLDPTLRG